MGASESRRCKPVAGQTSEWRVIRDLIKLQAAFIEPCRVKDQSRNARAGSVRVASQAGKRQAAIAVIIITAKPEPNASGSRGLALYR